jgi:peptidyl-prolyl cis-trans isomerase SurA
MRIHSIFRSIRRIGDSAWAAAVLLVAAVSLSAAESRVDSILATVNGNPVTLLDVVLETGRQEARLSTVYKGTELEEEIRKIRKHVIDEIIDRKLIVEDYRTYNFEIPRQFIETNLQDLAALVADGTMTGLRRKAETFGTSIEELREKAKEKVIMDIMIHEFCVRPVNVTPEEIYRHYQDNIEQYRRESELSIDAILILGNGRHGDRAPEVIAKITEALSGEPDEQAFTTLVRLHSEGPNAEKDGNLGSVVESHLRKEFADALPGKGVGAVVGPVKTPEGTYFLRIRDRKEETVVPLSKLSAAIEAELLEARKRERYEAYLGRLKKDAVIRHLF